MDGVPGSCCPSMGIGTGGASFDQTPWRQTATEETQESGSLFSGIHDKTFTQNVQRQWFTKNGSRQMVHYP